MAFAQPPTTLPPTVTIQPKDPQPVTPHLKPQNDNIANIQPRNNNKNANQTISKTLRRISLHPTLTPYRRRVYRTLLTIPPGRWTTYSALATHLDSSARAVGNAMRTNPFAPEVPCHRVLAADGSLGGYKGVWSRRGDGGSSKKEVEKRRVLEAEGVEFDAGGRARGVCFGEFGEV